MPEEKKNFDTKIYNGEFLEGNPSNSLAFPAPIMVDSSGNDGEIMDILIELKNKVDKLLFIFDNYALINGQFKQIK